MADESIIGYEFPAFRFKVEEGKLAEFAKAIHADDPVYFDAKAAQIAGFAAQPAPPTFSCATAHWQTESGVDPMNLDLTRVLAGGNEWEYHRPLLAGEEFTVRTHIVDVTRKQGSKGLMTLFIREMNFYDASGELALTARSTIIELPPPPPANESEVLPT